jgi:predicted anti-sigma-YlaC factor YlaD
MQISCREVRRELANYMEDDVSQELKVRIEQHFLTCEGCFATYDSLRRIIRLIDGADPKDSVLVSITGLQRAPTLSHQTGGST